MKSWKTTVGGLMLTIGTSLTQVHDPIWLSYVGTVIVGLSGLFLSQARDNNVSSKTVGAK
jgi:hypothetical protein